MARPEWRMLHEIEGSVEVAQAYGERITYVASSDVVYLTIGRMYLLTPTVMDERANHLRITNESMVRAAICPGAHDSSHHLIDTRVPRALQPCRPGGGVGSN